MPRKGRASIDILNGKNIVLGITGGIAAYKAAELSSKLVKRGAKVYAIMTKNSREIITPLTLETLTRNPVATDTFERPGTWEVEHISLAQRADVFLIAPATANIIGKMAHGIADDMLSTTVMATIAPIVVAPAMNTRMWEHPAVQENIKTLRSRGVEIVPPGVGLLACGDYGAGRLAETDDIIARLESVFLQTRDLAGKRVLVTAGPTREALDPVRYLTNHSSGKMGYALAEEAAKRGAQVTLISGPVSLPPPGINIVNIITTKDLLREMQALAPDNDIIIQCAAPSDFAPAELSAQKIKRKDGEALTLKLVANPDVAAAIGESARADQVLIGFAAETQNLFENAQAKLKKKHLDMIVANDVTLPGAGFASDTNIAEIITPDGSEQLPIMHKRDLAREILNRAIRILNNKIK